MVWACSCHCFLCVCSGLGLYCLLAGLERIPWINSLETLVLRSSIVFGNRLLHESSLKKYQVSLCPGFGIYCDDSLPLPPSLYLSPPLYLSLHPMAYGDIVGFRGVFKSACKHSKYYWSSGAKAYKAYLVPGKGLDRQFFWFFSKLPCIAQKNLFLVTCQSIFSEGPKKGLDWSRPRLIDWMINSSIH